MQFKNTLTQYGIVAIILHWLIAIIMIGLLILGLYMVTLPINLEKLKLYGWHKEYGILILFLAIARIAWRLSNVNPLFVDMPQWQKWAALSVHFAFYFFMLVLPITGWMISSAAGLPVSFFGLFILPDLVSANEGTRLFLSQVHKWLSYALILAICAHVGAALLHHFIYKDDTLKRMLP